MVHLVLLDLLLLLRYRTLVFLLLFGLFLFELQALVFLDLEVSLAYFTALDVLQHGLTALLFDGFSVFHDFLQEHLLLGCFHLGMVKTELATLFEFGTLLQAELFAPLEVGSLLCHVFLALYLGKRDPLLLGLALLDGSFLAYAILLRQEMLPLLITHLKLTSPLDGGRLVLFLLALLLGVLSLELLPPHLFLILELLHALAFLFLLLQIRLDLTLL